ncbi:MAG: glycosyltransferase family 25 protein [Parashewanella sp.]
MNDDIVLNDAFSKIISTPANLSNWDIIKLADNQNNPVVDSRTLDNGVEIVCYKRIPNCTTGYMISRQGAEKLLSRKRFYRAIDVDMQFHQELGLKIIGLRPYPITEADFDSEIALMNNGKHNNSSTFFRNVRFRLAIIKQRQKASADLNSITN